jgi:hypothetical protein
MEAIDLFDDEISDQDLTNIIAQLLEMGVLEIRGYDSISNQFTYNITPRCKELYPELFEEHFKMINDLAFKLWSKDLIELTFNKDGVPMVMPKNIEYTRSVMYALPEDERFFLENLLDKYEKDTKE